MVREKLQSKKAYLFYSKTLLGSSGKHSRKELATAEVDYKLHLSLYLREFFPELNCACTSARAESRVYLVYNLSSIFHQNPKSATKMSFRLCFKWPNTHK
ncbi:hypothetical protein ACOSQ2_003130 [Xanthoceras sorbifolium]